MEVSYQVALDDYVRYGLHVFWKAPSARSRFRMNWFVLPILSFVAAAILELEYSLTFLSVCLVGGGVGHLLFYPHLFWVSVERAVRRQAEELGAKGIVGRITLLLPEETLTEVTEVGRTEARCENMKGVEVVGACTFVYVTPLLRAILPRHGFDREGDYEAARDFADRKVSGRTRDRLRSVTAPPPATVRAHVSTSSRVTRNEPSHGSCLPLSQGRHLLHES